MRLDVLATGPTGPAGELDPLRQAGHRVTIGRLLDAPDWRPWTEAELVAAAREADVLLVSHLEAITAAVLEAAPRLRLVIAPFIGTDRIDVEAASRLGILVANSPTPENFVAVAEATVGLGRVGRELARRLTGWDVRLLAADPYADAAAARDLGVDPARLILTPHNVSHSEAGRRANVALALEQILALGRGEIPAHVVNPDAIPRRRSR